MRSKFNAIRTELDGIVFASKKESVRYSELKMLLKAGKIDFLELQPKFLIQVNGKKICNYLADFRYVENGKWVVEDVKGYDGGTPLYKLKKKLVEACHGVVIREV